MSTTDLNDDEDRSRDGSEHPSDRDFIAEEGSVETELTPDPDNPDQAGSRRTSDLGYEDPNVTILKTSANSGSQRNALTRDDHRGGQSSIASGQDSKGTGSKGPMEKDELKGQSSIQLESLKYPRNQPVHKDDQLMRQASLKESKRLREAQLNQAVLLSEGRSRTEGPTMGSRSDPRLIPIPPGPYVQSKSARAVERQSIKEQLKKSGWSQEDLDGQEQARQIGEIADEDERKYRAEIYWEFKAMRQVEANEELRKQEQGRKQEGQPMLDFQRHKDIQSQSGGQTRVEGLAQQSATENQTTKPWDRQSTAYDPKRPKDHSSEKETHQSLYQREESLWSKKSGGDDEDDTSESTDSGIRAFEESQRANNFRFLAMKEREARVRTAQLHERRRVEKEQELVENQRIEAERALYNRQEQLNSIVRGESEIQAKTGEIHDLVEQLQSLEMNQSDLRKTDRAKVMRIHKDLSSLRGSGPIDLVLKDQKETADWDLRPGTFLSVLADSWKTDHFFYAQSRREGVHKSLFEMCSLLDEASIMLERNEIGLREELGDEVVQGIWTRHSSLAEAMRKSVRQGRISRGTAKLIPEHQAEEIMNWYCRLVVGLQIMDNARQKASYVDSAMCAFVLTYPGPESQMMADSKPREKKRKAAKDSDEFREALSSPFEAKLDPKAKDEHFSAFSAFNPEDPTGSHASQQGGTRHQEWEMIDEEEDVPRYPVASVYPNTRGRAKLAGKVSSKQTQEAIEQSKDLAHFLRYRRNMDQALGVQAFRRSTQQRMADEQIDYSPVPSDCEDYEEEFGPRAEERREDPDYRVRMSLSERRRMESEYDRINSGSWENPRVLSGSTVRRRSKEPEGYPRYVHPDDRREERTGLADAIRKIPGGFGSARESHREERCDTPEAPRGAERADSASLSAVSSVHSRMSGMATMSRPAMDGVTLELEETMVVSDFEDCSMEEIKESIRQNVIRKLVAQSCDSETARRMICTHWPQFNLHPRPNKTEDSKQFKTIARNIRPNSEGDFIAFDDWLESIKTEADNQGYSIRHRIVWLKATGGLAPGVNDAIRDSVVNRMKNIILWMPDYNPATLSTNNNYWFQVWADVVVMLVKHFFTVQYADQAEADYNKGLKQAKYKLRDSEMNPINREWYKFKTCWDDMWTMLIKRGSGLLDAPLMVWNLFQEHWKTQGKRGVGHMMVNLVDRALNMLDQFPADVFDRHIVLTDEELVQIKREGKFKASMKTYSMIMEKLGRQAARNELTLDLTNLSLLDKVTGSVASTDGFTRSKADHKREKKTLSVKTATSTSGVSELTVNTVTDRPKVLPCSSCGLYHSTISTCPLVKDGNLNLDAIIKYKSVRQINKEGQSSLNSFWKKKFRMFMLKKFGMESEDDQDKWFKKLESMLKKLPVASEEAIKKYQADNLKFINMCKSEEGKDDNYVNNLVKDHRGKATKPHRIRPGRIAAGIDEESESDSDSSTGESSTGS